MHHNYFIVALFVALTFAACKPTREQYRADFVKGCVNRFAKDSAVASREGRKAVEDYCNCLGDAMNARMDADQWRTFNKSSDTTLETFQKDFEPCTNDFSQKILTLPASNAQ
ncbi:MAG: hypothetical protein QM642_12110 [Edaphocola sp.]